MACCAICFTTDQAYLLPTLVSAIQARRNCRAQSADIIIFCFEAEREAMAAYLPVCAAEGIRCIFLSRGEIDEAPVMLARLFLDRIVPPEYSQLLYLDGDIQIIGSIDPLVEADVPAGHFLAANDPITFSTRDLACHTQSLGLSGAKARSYFNSGVMRINRDGWNEIGMGAWNLFQLASGGWRFPDQDVLNIVATGRRLPMSLIWNFPIFLRNTDLHRSLMPRVNHFMSSPKPWEGVFPPWAAADHQPYADIVQAYPALQSFVTAMPFARRLRYHLQQRFKRRQEAISWGWRLERRGVLAYETAFSNGLPLFAASGGS